MQIFTEEQIRAMDRERLIMLALNQQKKLSDINTKLQIIRHKMDLYRQGQHMDDKFR